MPSSPTSAPVFLLSLSLLAASAGAAKFSRSEWIDAGRPGQSIWIRNGGARAVTLEAFSVRTLGFQGFGEVAFNAGPRRAYFSVQGDARGRWARLVPRDGRRIRVRAHDSLMLSGFECGARLRAAQEGKRAAEEFVLDLKVTDSRGDTSQVKVIQLAPQYRIQDEAGVADPRAREE
jgi:hypothetical protein